MEEEEGQDDNTHSSGSVVSGLTDLENDTDEFGKLLAQSARDEQRLNDALRGDGRAFSKARPKPGVLAVLENFERRNAPEEEARKIDTEEGLKKSTSETENQYDPPDLNVPREWGRKGKYKNDWLRRIGASEQTQSRDQQNDTTEIPQRRRTSLAGLSADHPNSGGATSSADVPRPSTEHGSSPFRASFNGSTPPSIRQRNTSLDKVRQWELEQDLSVESFLASTPGLVRNNKALDDIREREIASLKGRAVTTSRLDEIAEKIPEARPLRKSQFRESPKTQRQVINGFAPNPDHDIPAVKHSSSETREKAERLTSPEGVIHTDGEVIPNSPIVVYRSTQTESVDLVETVIQTNTQPEPQRLEHRREDSRDLLRQLARATSASPTPATTEITSKSRRHLASMAEAKQGFESRGEENARSLSPHITDTADTSPEMGSSFEIVQAPVTELRPALDDLPEERNPNPAEDELAVHPGALPQPSARDSAPPVSPVHVDLAVPETPVVTGAWVNTPRTAKRQREGARVDADDEPELSPRANVERPVSEASEAIPQRTALKEPSHPKSALDAIVQDARSNSLPSNDAWGESTIESLEELLDREHDLSSLLNPHGDTRDDSLESLDAASLSPAARQRALEMLALERMDQRLRAARTSIRDANRGMKRVERKVEAADESGQGACTRCGCPANGRLHYSPFRDLWTWLRSRFWIWDGKGRLRFTWLGLLSLLFLIWFFSEATLCEYYCHPLYADRVEGYGVDINAPRMPYVTITVLTRPFEWLWGPFYDPVASFLTTIVDFFLGPDTEAGSRLHGVGRFGIIKNGRLFESWPRENSYTDGLEYEAFRSVVRASIRTASQAATKAAGTLASRQTGSAEVLMWSMGEDEVL